MVTIKEIAREANISPTTVSLILNHKARERKISAETEQRVLQIAARMGYLLPDSDPVGGGFQSSHNAAFFPRCGRDGGAGKSAL